MSNRIYIRVGYNVKNKNSKTASEFYNDHNKLQNYATITTRSKFLNRGKGGGRRSQQASKVSGMGGPSRRGGGWKVELAGEC